MNVISPIFEALPSNMVHNQHA